MSQTARKFNHIALFNGIGGFQLAVMPNFSEACFISISSMFAWLLFSFSAISFSNSNDLISSENEVGFFAIISLFCGRNTLTLRYKYSKIMLKNVDYCEAYKFYADGLSLSMVAALYNVTRQSVFKSFKRKGFKMREKIQLPPVEYLGKKFTINHNGYYRMTDGKRELMHRFVWESINGKIPAGYDIHHLNEVKTDNRIENLECLPKAEHTRKYSPHNNQYTKGRKRAAY